MRGNNTAPGGDRVIEQSPISILQAHGGGAIPRVALWTTERVVRFLSQPAVEQPCIDRKFVILKIRDIVYVYYD